MPKAAQGIPVFRHEWPKKWLIFPVCHIQPVLRRPDAHSLQRSEISGIALHAHKVSRPLERNPMGRLYLLFCKSVRESYFCHESPRQRKTYLRKL